MNFAVLGAQKAGFIGIRSPLGQSQRKIDLYIANRRALKCRGRVGKRVGKTKLHDRGGKLGVVGGQLGHVNNHVVRSFAVCAATEGAVVFLAGLAGIENIGREHHLHENPLAARITNNAAERADDVWVHRAN